jgi:hypothetical protein
VLIILAPIIMEIPAATEKNAVAEEMSRMIRGGVKGILQHKLDPATCSLLFAIIRWPVPKKSAPPAERTLTDISLATIRD